MSVPLRGFTTRRLWGTLLLTLVIPVLVYSLARPLVGDDATALGYTAASELLVSLLRTGIRRRWTLWSILLTLTAIAWFGGALALTVSSHGATLPFKLERAVYTGIIGLVVLGSAAVGRPLGGSRVHLHLVDATTTPTVAIDDPPPGHCVVLDRRATS